MFDGAASCSPSLRAARVPAHKHTGPALFLPSEDFEKQQQHACVCMMADKNSTFMMRVLLRRNSMRLAMTELF